MNTENPKLWLERIRALPLPDHVRIMNVCGGHERTIAMAGIRSVLPEGVELIAGPGCPVCVCPEEDIYDAMRLALDHDVILVAFGDMLRVPVNAPKSGPRSLEEARAAGADIRPIASPAEARRIARDNPDRAVVFLAAGFETTMAPVAALMAEGLPDNLSMLLSGRLTWPAVEMLLASGDANFDALIAPGHVATVMGAAEWRFVPEAYQIPTAVGGFSATALLVAIYSVLRQVSEGRCFLDNCYPAIVREEGNPAARRVIDSQMQVRDAPWRGIGPIAASGYALRDPALDAHSRFDMTRDETRRRLGEMPPGCDCAGVVLGRIRPSDCRLYGRACTPGNPVGPCMVSDEGACRIWWQSGARPALAAK